MAEIPRKLLNDLSDELNALSAEGQRMVLNVLENAEWSSIEELREIAIEAMEQVCGTVTDMAAARTAEFYDDVRIAAVGEALGAEPLSGRVPEATQGAVRAGIQSVVETGAIEQFGRFLTARVDYEIKRSSFECVYQNGKRDPLKPKYARVPAGAETCSFCIMLASRGFVYATKESAGEGNHYHANCDCRIVPGFDGETTVAGYDPDTLYDQWKHPEKYPQLQEARNARRRELYAEKRGQTRKKPSDAEIRRSTMKPVNKQTYNSVKNRIERLGGIVLRGGEEVERHLDLFGADASCVDGVLMFRANPTISEVLEESFHFDQELRGDYADKPAEQMRILREIDAQKHLIQMTDRYKIPESEVEMTKRNLAYYEEELLAYERRQRK